MPLKKSLLSLILPIMFFSCPIETLIRRIISAQRELLKTYILNLTIISQSWNVINVLVEKFNKGISKLPISILRKRWGLCLRNILTGDNRVKKLAFTLMACFAFMQSVQAIESPLNSSIHVSTHILTSEKVQEVLSQNEYIIDLRRLTWKLEEFGTVYYEIVTKEPSKHHDRFDRDADFDMDIDAELNARHSYSSSSSDSCSDSWSHKRPKPFKFITYKVRLLVEPNPEIGPPIVIVESIKKVKNHWEGEFPKNSN